MLSHLIQFDLEKGVKSVKKSHGQRSPVDTHLERPLSNCKAQMGPISLALGSLSLPVGLAGGAGQAGSCLPSGPGRLLRWAPVPLAGAEQLPIPRETTVG